MKKIALLVLIHLIVVSYGSDSTKVKKVHFSGIALPARSPENGFYVQGGLIAGFKTVTNDSTLRASNAYLYGLYSQLHQWRISLGGSIFTPSEKYFINFWYYGSYLPERYFGIGSHTSPSTSELVSYHIFHVETFLLRKVAKGNFLGLAHYFESIDNISYPKQGIMDTQKPLGITANSCHGIGPMYRHDTRDHLFSSTKGSYVELSWVHFRPFWGSDHSFSVYKADLRKFWPIIKTKEHICALQLTYTGTEGQTPLRWLPGISSRAYHPNLYRDQHLYMLQAEYRLRIWRWFGASAFGGIAQTSPSIAQFAYTPIRPNGGLGLRFKLVPKHNLHLRIDYGIGQNTSNYYIAFYDTF